jgi:hypothetical protein
MEKMHADTVVVEEEEEVKVEDGIPVGEVTEIVVENS